MSWKWNSFSSAILLQHQPIIFFSHTTPAAVSSHQPVSSIFFSHYSNNNIQYQHSTRTANGEIIQFADLQLPAAIGNVSVSSSSLPLGSIPRLSHTDVHTRRRHCTCTVHTGRAKLVALRSRRLWPAAYQDKVNSGVGVLRTCTARCTCSVLASRSWRLFVWPRRVQCGPAHLVCNVIVNSDILTVNYGVTNLVYKINFKILASDPEKSNEIFNIRREKLHPFLKKIC